MHVHYVAEYLQCTYMYANYEESWGMHEGFNTV